MIAAGWGYLASAWVGVALAVIGLALAVLSFRLDARATNALSNGGSEPNGMRLEAITRS